MNVLCIVAIMVCLIAAVCFNVAVLCCWHKFDNMVLSDDFTERKLERLEYLICKFMRETLDEEDFEDIVTNSVVRAMKQKGVGFVTSIPVQHHEEEIKHERDSMI